MADPANLLIAISFMVLGFDIGSKVFYHAKLPKREILKVRSNMVINVNFHYR